MGQAKLDANTVRQEIFRERLSIRSGGVFDFDAVSEDRSIVATISTSGSKTSGGKNAVGKILKLRSDMLFLTMVEAERRIIVQRSEHVRDLTGSNPDLRFVVTLPHRPQEPA